MALGGKLEYSYMGELLFFVLEKVQGRKKDMMEYAGQPYSSDTSAYSASYAISRLCAYPDVSWIFEKSTESTGMRTADENIAL